MKKLLALGALTILAGCSEEAAVEGAVKAYLLDPDSAKIGEITIVETEDGKQACATTNAKNRFGGYTGNKQISLSYDDEAGVWEAITSWEWSHDMCVRAISATAGEADEGSSKEALELETEDTP